MMASSLSLGAITFVLLGIPYLFLLRKAGISPWWSLIFLIAPMNMLLGAWVGLPMLALRAWPSRNEVPNRYFFAEPENILMTVVHVVIPILSFFVILKKVGYSGWWCLSMLFPPVAIVVLWVCAFRKDNNAQAGEVLRSGFPG